MILDPEIKLAGIDCVIVRAGGNLNTTIYYGHVGKISPNARGNPDEAHEAGYFLPTDCGAALGDLLLIDDSYYLLMSFQKIFNSGVHACYKGVLYECNATVSIYQYNLAARKHSTLREAGVRCLLDQGGNAGQSDKSYAIPKYQGKNTPYDLYMQSSAGLTKDDIIVDQDSRRYRIQNDFDPYVANGITQTRVSVEG